MASHDITVSSGDEEVYLSSGNDEERDELQESEVESKLNQSADFQPVGESEVRENAEEEEEEDDDNDTDDDDDSEEEESEEEEKEKEDNEEKEESEESDSGEREECPTPQLQKEIMKKLEMKRPPLREGDVWYLIEYGWYQKWKRHVKYDWVYDINIPTPDFIDNSNLLVPGTEILKQAMFENQDFTVITYKEWKKLLSWY